MRCSTPLVFLAPPLSRRARASQVQVPLSPSRRILCLTSRIVSHCAAAQLWPVLTDCAMETGDLSLLQEPQISRSIEAGGLGEGQAEAACSGVQTRLPLESSAPQTQPQVRARSHTCKHAHPSAPLPTQRPPGEDVRKGSHSSSSFPPLVVSGRGPDSRGGENGQNQICRWPHRTKKMKRRRSFAWERVMDGEEHGAGRREGGRAAPSVSFLLGL